MHFLVVIFLGIIEGLTEFIPVSSTGHLLLAQQWLPDQGEVFNIVIQCGAALAIIPAFAGRIRQLLLELDQPSNRDLLLKLGAAFFITCAGGLIMKKLNFHLPHSALPIAWATLAGGIAIFLVEGFVKNRPATSTITWSIAIAVGVGQLIAAAFPGSSRSATTILMALLLGLDRAKATEFSFLLGLPTLLAAGVLETHHALKHPMPGEIISWPAIALGALVSAIVAFVVVKWFISFVRSHTFIGFGIYRVALGIAMLAWFWPKK